MTEKIRVFQVATGNVGTEMIKRIAKRPDLELIGLHCYTPEKVGRDAGEIAGIEPIGVTATGSATAQVPAAVLWGVPTAAALGSGALMRWLWNRLRRSMPLDTAPPTAAELVGEKVTVLWWKDGSGEVRAVTRGHQLTLPAHSEQPLRSGQSAWVLDAVDSTLAIVPWEQISD